MLVWQKKIEPTSVLMGVIMLMTKFLDEVKAKDECACNIC